MKKIRNLIKMWYYIKKNYLPRRNYMEKIELTGTNRTVLGKKARFLRRQGITPVHLYGHGIESMALQCDTAKLKLALVKAGGTRLISLKLDNEKRIRTVVVREVQREPRTGESLHVDFFQVKVSEEVKIEVPIILIGEAPVLKSKEYILLQELDTLTVQCLPASIPHSVEIDVSSLVEPEQAVRVKDIELDKEVIIFNDPELVVIRIRPRFIEKMEEMEVIAEEGLETPDVAPLSEHE
jgi:large subunit ribosomal protein L25